MRIEKITENTIKVTLVAKDFENRGIEASKLKFNTPACQELLWDIIDHAEIEMGLDGLGDRIIVETVADGQGNCVITVTRSEDPHKTAEENTKEAEAQEEGNSDEMEELLDALFSVPGSASSEISKISREAKYEDYSIFCFTDFESLLGAVWHCPDTGAIPSRLYTYNDCYYLLLSISERNFCTGIRFEEVCYEFGGSKAVAKVMTPILQEHAKLLIRRNALQSLMNKFSKK